MADQRSRGGKKEGTDAPQGQSEKQQPVHAVDPNAANHNEPGGRPPAGEPGGPKENAGQTRPQND